MEIKPRKEYVIVKTEGVAIGPKSSGYAFVTKPVYLMHRRYAVERIAKRVGLIPDTNKYVATGLSYKQAKQMMKLFKEQ
jgi:hypothetical protein